jgi:2-hydroxychromene-2-carboxylate isomerase
MSEQKLTVFFNFRSPYCYIASKTMFPLFDKYNVDIEWKPFGGWGGRSAPERAKVKIPLVRQDMRRITQRMGIPMNPPPPTTDPTKAGAASLYAEREGKLREFVVETMRAEWAEGRDIGEDSVIALIAERIGLDDGATVAAAADEANLEQLQRNWEEAENAGVFGVPTFIVDDEVFWGSDRMDYLEDHLRELRLARL